MLAKKLTAARGNDGSSKRWKPLAVVISLANLDFHIRPPVVKPSAG